MFRLRSVRELTTCNNAQQRYGPRNAKKTQANMMFTWVFAGAPGGIRTPNLLIRSQNIIVLYPP